MSADSTELTTAEKPAESQPGDATTPGAQQKPRSSKERMLALVGIWADDPMADALIEAIDRRRKANPVGAA